MQPTNVDSIFAKYYAGQIDELLDNLRELTADYAQSGDIVLFSRVFSYYGTINLFCSNDFIASTLFRQINEEYSRNKAGDPRIVASQARFLALYCSFSGRIEDASAYYKDARSAYLETDWYADEAATLLESVCFHYLFAGDAEESTGAIDRLELLNDDLGGLLDGDLAFLRSVSPSFGSKENKLMKPGCRGPVENMERLSFPAQILLSFVLMGDALSTFVEAEQANRVGSLPILPAVTKNTRHNCPIRKFIGEVPSLLDMASRGEFDLFVAAMDSVKAKVQNFGHPGYRGLFEKMKPLAGMKNNVIRGDIATSGRVRPAAGLFAGLLGKCLLSRGNTVYDMKGLGTKNGNELLLFLLTRRNLEVHKEALAEIFYPGGEPSRAFNRIHVNIHRLNRVLETHFGFQPGTDFVHVRQGIIRINQDILEEYDVENYRKMLSVADELRANGKEAAAELSGRAIAMYSGDIAPGFYYFDWLDEFRNGLKSMQVKALTRMFEHSRGKNDPKACSEAFQSLIELDPLNEDYYIDYIDFIVRDGRNVEAVQLYNRYKAGLKRELGLEPSTRLKSLMSGIAG